VFYQVVKKNLRVPEIEDRRCDRFVVVKRAPFAIAVIYGFWVFFCEFAGTLFTDGFFVKIFDGYWLPWLKVQPTSLVATRAKRRKTLRASLLSSTSRLASSR